MTDGKCSCDAIQAAILSDEALSEEQKKHIEACNECKALLSQTEAMKRDLGALSVPGISKGSIADGVMQRIKEEKISAPVHKFKITHHLGTAAAIVIILAAALMIKNPSETDFDAVPENENSPVAFSSPANNHKLSSPEAVYDYADEEEAVKPMHEEAEVVETTADSIENYKEAEEEVRNNSARVMMKGARPPEIAYATDTQAELESDGTEQIMLMSEESVEEEVVEEESASPEISPALGSGSAGGSGGGSSANDTGAVLMDVSDEASNSSFIFEGIDFGTDDEDFESNINLANERLYEVFGEGYVISRAKLEGFGIDNKTFVKYAKSVTREMIETYGNVIDIFE